MNVKSLSDIELLCRTEAIRAKEAELLFEFLTYLGEIDARRLYRDEGYPSLHAYLVEGLEYSEGAAHRRTVVARAMRRLPEFSKALTERSFSFAAAYELARVTTEENVGVLVRECSKRSKADVENTMRWRPRGSLERNSWRDSEKRLK